MTSMKCTIPGVHLKVFGRAIQSLSKIGDELYFEPLEDGLYLRTVNSCRSAYGFFQFSPSFFLHYIDGTASSSSDEGDNGLRCKIGMKSVMTVFKSLANIDKTVEKCRIALNMTEARLVFQMYCRHGIVKTHNLAFIECDSLQAVFSKDLCPNKITARPKLLCDAVLNFQSMQEEITLIVRPDILFLKNYTEDEQDKTKVIHTELTLDPDEFDQYQVGVDTEITFCLKEMRAILAFVDITDLPLGLHFEAAGRPVTFTINSDLSFEANFVLATLAEPSASQMPPPTQRKDQGSMAKKHSNKRPHSNNNHHKNNDSGANSQSNTLREEEDMDDNDDAELSRIMDITVPDCSVSNTHRSNSHPSSSKISKQTPAKRTLSSGFSKPNDVHSNFKHLPGPTTSKQTSSKSDNIFNKTNDKLKNNNSHQNSSNECSVEHNGEESSIELSRAERREVTGHKDSSCAATSHLQASTSTLRQQTNLLPGSPIDVLSPQVPLSRPLLALQDFNNSPDMSQVIPVMSDTLNSRIHTEPDISQDDNDDDDDEEEVPGTPPSKKFKALLFGTQSSTQASQSQSSRIEVLAPDSDDDS